MDRRRFSAVSNVAEQHLLHEFTHGAAILKREIGYNPAYFMQMVAGTARSTRASDSSTPRTPQTGHAALGGRERLDMTVEQSRSFLGALSCSTILTVPLIGTGLKRTAST